MVGGPLNGKELNIKDGENYLSIPLMFGPKSFAHYNRVHYSDERGDQFEFTE